MTKEFVLETGPKYPHKLWIGPGATFTEERETAETFPSAADALRRSNSFSILLDLQVVEATQ